MLCKWNIGGDCRTLKRYSNGGEKYYDLEVTYTAALLYLRISHFCATALKGHSHVTWVTPKLMLKLRRVWVSRIHAALFSFNEPLKTPRSV